MKIEFVTTNNGDDIKNYLTNFYFENIRCVCRLEPGTAKFQVVTNASSTEELIFFEFMYSGTNNVQCIESMIARHLEKKIKFNRAQEAVTLAAKNYNQCAELLLSLLDSATNQEKIAQHTQM